MSKVMTFLALLLVLLAVNGSPVQAEVERNAQGSFSRTKFLDNRQIMPFSLVFFHVAPMENKRPESLPLTFSFYFPYFYRDSSKQAQTQPEPDIDSFGDSIFEPVGTIYINNQEFPVRLLEYKPISLGPGAASSTGAINLTNFAAGLRSARSVAFKFNSRVKRINGLLWRVPDDVLKEWKSLL